LFVPKSELDNLDIQVMNAETLFTEFLIEHNIPLREELNYL